MNKKTSCAGAADELCVKAFFDDLLALGTDDGYDGAVQFFDRMGDCAQCGIDHVSAVIIVKSHDCDPFRDRNVMCGGVVHESERHPVRIEKDRVRAGFHDTGTEFHAFFEIGMVFDPDELRAFRQRGFLECRGKPRVACADISAAQNLFAPASDQVDDCGTDSRCAVDIQGMASLDAFLINEDHCQRILAENVHDLR